MIIRLSLKTRIRKLILTDVVTSHTVLTKVLIMYRGADKSLARPGRKKARKHVRDAREFNNIETQAVIKFFFSCKARRLRKFTPFRQKH